MTDMSGSNCRIRSDSLVNRVEGCVKVEDVKVKCEEAECGVCAGRSSDCVDAREARSGAGSTLADVLSRHAPRDLLSAGTTLLCRTCRALLDALDQAELEYLKQKESFEAIISRNPLYENRTHIPGNVKIEFECDSYVEPQREESEDDMPLAITKEKKKRRVYTRKKKIVIETKKKSRAKDKISVEVLKKSTMQPLGSNVLHSDVKTEDSIDGSETSSQLNNGLHSELKLEIDEFANDDDDSDFLPDDFPDDAEAELETVRGGRRPRPRPRPRPRAQPHAKSKPKIVYECDQCDAKYTSCKRFEIHKEKHSEGKPPFICEVCGASYKHKRACDIHIALHRGISDWKCEECNKLFPSKGALQRHNNIHTGKLNYQCDLCGKSFIHTSSFKMHKLSHSGVKPHSCDVCGLALMTRSHLKRHKRVHSGEKRHECALCGKRFSERYNLLAHAKSHETAGEVVAPAPAVPRRRLFRCTFCQERFERRYMLERHVSTAHGRTLERLPATPRNTMSKLLKAQAQARAQPPPAAPPAAAPAPAPAAPPAPPHTPASDVTDTKGDRSPESRITILTHKLQQASSTLAATSWSGAYAAEFGIRTDFPH